MAAYPSLPARGARSASRPNEASKVAICNGRFTSSTSAGRNAQIAVIGATVHRAHRTDPKPALRVLARGRDPLARSAYNQRFNGFCAKPHDARRGAMSETRKIAAILVSDVVGYSRLAGADEDRTLARLRALRSDLIDPDNLRAPWPHRQAHRRRQRHRVPQRRRRGALRARSAARHGRAQRRGRARKAHRISHRHSFGRRRRGERRRPDGRRRQHRRAPGRDLPSRARSACPRTPIAR